MQKSENFSIKVPIKHELKKGLVFGLRARLPIAIIIGFIGYRHDVMPMMQKLSHGTRAYICNAKGLPGFVDELHIVEILKLAEEKGQLEHAKNWQVLEIDNIVKQLERL